MTSWNRYFSKFIDLWKKQPGWLVALSLLALGLLAFGHTLSYDFVWDDEGLIVRNPYIKSVRNLFALFAQDLYWGRSGDNYYRPIQALSYLVEHAIWGLRPWGFRLTNILLHVGCATLLYHLFSRLTERRKTAFVAAAFWLIHPIQPEAVTYIAGRADSLSASFVVAALWFHWRALEGEGRRRKWSLVWAAGMFGLAMWTKEIAFVFIPLVLVIEVWWDSNYSVRKVALRSVSYVVVLLLYGWARFAVLPSLFGEAAEQASIGHPFVIFSFPMGLLSGLRFLAWPHPLHLERLAPGIGPYLLWWMVSATAIAGLAGYAVWKYRERFPVLWLSAFFYVIGLLPLIVLAYVNQLFLHHWLYLPSYAVFFVIVAAIEDAGRSQPSGWTRARRKKAAVWGSAIFLAFLMTTFAQNRVWRDRITLLQHILEYVPTSRRVHYNLGLAYYARDRWREARREFEIARELMPGSDVDASIALLDSRSGSVESALELFNRAVELEPENPIYRNNRASALHQVGRGEEALADLQEAVGLDPYYQEAWYNLGIIFRGKRNLEKALPAFEKAADLRPNQKVVIALGRIYLHQRRLDDALTLVNKGLKEDPDSAEMINLEGVVYAERNELNRAREVWTEGLIRHPDDPQIKTNLDRLNNLK